MWNAVEQFFADWREREDEENDTFYKDGEEGKLPTVSHAQNNGIAEKGVDAEAWSKRKGIVRKETHHGRTDSGCDNGCNKYAAFGHPCYRKNFRIYGQNIGHGHEGNEPGEKFGMDCRVVFGQMEKFFEHHPFFSQFSIFPFGKYGFSLLHITFLSVFLV